MFLYGMQNASCHDCKQHAIIACEIVWKSYIRELIIMLSSKEAVLAEYTAIKEWCKYAGDAQNTLFIFAFTAGGTILSFSLQQENPYIALVNFIVLIAIRCRIMRFRNTISKNETYMRIFLEPLLQIDSAKMRLVKCEGISIIQYFIYSLIGLASVVVYFLFNPCSIIALVLCLFLFVVVVFLDCYYFFGKNRLYNQLEAKWRTLKDSDKQHKVVDSIINTK